MSALSTTRPAKARPILLTILLLIAILLIWIGSEIYFAITARPNVDTNYGKQMQALAATVQGEGPDRWDAYLQLLAEHDAIDSLVAANVRAIAPRNSQVSFRYDVVHDFDSIAAEVPEDEDLYDTDRASELARLDASRAAYVKALESWDESGFVGRLRSLRESQGVFVRPMPREGLLINVLLPELGEARLLGRAMRARAHLAAEAGDWDEYVETVADGLWLAGVVEHEPILISGLVGASVRINTLDAVRNEVLSGRVPAATLETLAALLMSNQPPRPDHALHGEQLWALDFVQHTHDQRGRLMLSRLRLAEGNDQGLPPIANLGSVALPRREATEHAVREHYARLADQARLTPGQRLAQNEADSIKRSHLPSNQLALKAIAPSIKRVLRTFDEAMLKHLGLVTMLAIERHRAEHGEPPASLDDLVPTYLDAVPADPWAVGGSFGYRCTDSHPGYILYTVGADGEDNEGTRPAAFDDKLWDQEALNGYFPGTDFVLTQPASE